MGSSSGGDELVAQVNEGFLGELLSALAYTLMLIFAGFVMRSARVLNDAEVGGLSRFCGMLALPCALFKSVVDLDWSSVDWTLLLGMFLSKLIIFVFTALASLSRSRSPEAIARAGLFAIFVTKSNDIAFALPIVSAIFPPRYTKMVYLFVPLQLAIINPMGLMMMDYGSSEMKAEQDRLSGKLVKLAGPAGCRLRGPGGKLLVVFFSTLTSPVMVAVLLGLLLNFAARGRVPMPITQFVEIGSQAYTATALLTVGTSLSVVGGSHGRGPPLDGIQALVGTSLIVVKVFVAALVMYHICGLLTAYDRQTISFAFVYGCMPPAPTVYVWARQYGICYDLTGKMLVASLLVATPFIVVTGLMIDLGSSRGNLTLTRGLLNTATESIDVLAVAASVWMLTMLVVSRRMRSGFRLELLPLVLCNAISSLSALACVRTAYAPAAKLPIDAIRQVSQHAAVTFATCLSVRLFRSLRMSPERLRAERAPSHCIAVGVALLVTGCQLADGSRPAWPDGDPRANFHCVFGLFNARAPVVRIVQLTLSLGASLLPLLLFNARYLRTELRLNAEEAKPRGGGPSDGEQYAVSVLKSGGGKRGGGFVKRPRRGAARRGAAALEPIIWPPTAGGGPPPKAGAEGRSGAAGSGADAPHCPEPRQKHAGAGAGRPRVTSSSSSSIGSDANTPNQSPGACGAAPADSQRADSPRGAAGGGGGVSRWRGACAVENPLALPSGSPPLIMYGVPRSAQPPAAGSGSDSYGRPPLVDSVGPTAAPSPVPFECADNTSVGALLRAAVRASRGGVGGSSGGLELSGASLQQQATAQEQRVAWPLESIGGAGGAGGGHGCGGGGGSAFSEGEGAFPPLAVVVEGEQARGVQFEAEQFPPLPRAPPMAATWYERLDETGPPSDDGRRGAAGADLDVDGSGDLEAPSALAPARAAALQPGAWRTFNGAQRSASATSIDGISVAPTDDDNDDDDDDDDDDAGSGENERSNGDADDDDDDDDDPPWVEVRITRRRRRSVQASAAELSLAVSRVMATATAVSEAVERQRDSQRDHLASASSTAFSLRDSLRGSSLRGSLLSSEQRNAASHAAPAQPGASPGPPPRRGRGGLRGSNALNYIPMMDSLVWGPHHDTKLSRDTHAAELNETFNDSIRYLIVLSAAIFSMVLQLSTALQDVSAVSLTMLQEEIVVVTRLAFHGQLLVMAACFGLHPIYVEDLRRVWRRLLTRLRAFWLWRSIMRVRSACTHGGPADPNAFRSLRRQFSWAKARFE